MDLRFSLIPAAATLELRLRVLRPYLTDPLACHYPEDSLPLTFHLGAFAADRLVSVATFHTQAHPDLPGGNPYRLRGMATDESARGSGVGSRLVLEGVGHLLERRCDLLWFNARIKAFSFYERLGFLSWGELFEIDRIGAHKVMYKHLNPR